jgi:hypothetical protein
MRLLELEIHNVRGIRCLSLEPAGKNFVVWGPNGSGKSAVIDAIDFLLTGRISRLTGRGTGGITLNKHGPHIDCKPEEAIVRAVVQIQGTEPIEIKRCMAHPNVLEYDKSVAPHLEPILTLARRGQHVLTRREILKFITAEAGTRAQEIQELLNISEIEDIRKSLGKVQGDLEKELEAVKRTVEMAKGGINATIQAKHFQEDAVLHVVNQNRAVLKGQPIADLLAVDLKTELVPPNIVPISRSINITLLERDMQNLLSVMSAQNQAQIAKNDGQLRTSTMSIRSNPQLLHALSHLKLIELGMPLIDESGSCPLCGTAWAPGKLREHLEQQLSDAHIATQHQAQISKLSDSIKNTVNTIVASLQKVIAVTQTIGLADELQQLQLWLGNLQALSSTLDDPIGKYPDPRFGSAQVQRLLAPDNLEQVLSHMRSEVKAKYPETTPEQTAWDTLTRLEENLKNLELAQRTHRDTELSQKRAVALSESFQTARDTVLGKLYDDIRDRFAYLYRFIHGSDEDKFTAKLETDGAALNLEVDFYGRGTHPPHALHSEGHQDSMGVCLYLALAERLTGNLMDLVLLDDVVMSVDADHRRQFCNLLATCFPNRQFLITTHDRTWMNQLRSEKVISSQGIIEFYNWNVETGPRVNYEVDMWKRIEEDLQKNDVSSAAGLLRRGSEGFFGMVWDMKYRKAPPEWSYTDANPFTPDGSYGLAWSSFCILDKDDDQFFTGKCGDGPFSVRCGRRVAHLENRLIDFLHYENGQGRTAILLSMSFS